MTEASKTPEPFNQFTDKAVDAMTLWADANQRVARELVELSVGAAKESVRLYAEIQQGAIEAMRETQATALRWQSAWQEAPKDPVRWYQKSLVESVDTAQKAFRFVEGTSQAVTRSAERLQASAEQAGKSIQETFTSLVGKTKDLYSQN